MDIPNIDVTAEGRPLEPLPESEPQALEDNTVNSLDDANAKYPSTEDMRDVILSSPAYDWLIAALRKELRSIRARPDIMDAIRREILEGLSTEDEVSRKVPATWCKVHLRLDWDLITFLEEQQYNESSHIALERAITLTGSADSAQAAATADYLVQTWPMTGVLIMQMMREAICSRDSRATCKYAKYLLFYY